MRRKGFTLIELLAVIVILAVIALITIPLIGNVIEDSRKKAFESSVHGLVEAANYYTIEHDGIYEFLFDEEKKGMTKKGEQLDYRGVIEAGGKLYIDSNGDVSLCLMNEKYYAYKNYNSGIYIGEKKDNRCVIGYDAITNKYVAALDDGTGSISNVYTKEEINSIVDDLQEQIDTNQSDIANIKEQLSMLENSVHPLKDINGSYEVNVVFGKKQGISIVSNTIFIGDVSNKKVTVTRAAVYSIKTLSDSEVVLLNNSIEKNEVGFSFTVVQDSFSSFLDGYTLRCWFTIEDL